MLDLDKWRAGGSRMPLIVNGSERRIFCRVDGGAGAWATLLHGFPTSSWDWAPLVHALKGAQKTLALDFLGFGASDKPRPHVYRFEEQLSLVLAAWAYHGVTSTIIVAHDYAVSVAQEILARIRDGTWTGPHIEAVVLLNGGLAYSAQRPLFIQRVLRAPVVGPVAARFINARAFNRNFSRVFAEGREPDAGALVQHWRAITERGGRLVYPLISRYHEERRVNEARWMGALADAPVRTRYVWGMRDPVSGADMLARVRRDVPDADIVALDDVGHYPHLEAPARVAASLVQLFPR